MGEFAARLPLFELPCVDDSGTERLFYYDHERDEVDSDIIYFRVHPRNPPRECVDHWFSLELKRMDSASYWLKDIAANQHRGKCIPEALLKEATRPIQADIVSSIKD